MLRDYEIVIGLETHVQLLTASKLFCACSTAFTLEPNINVCPVCLGLPGSLPVLNRQAVALALRAALALNCRVPAEIRFDRKHYYYPDLPKNYQISQYELPLAVEGWLDIPLPEGEKRIRIRRAHLEEDAGKLLHAEGHSAVDLNRAGTPLLEIVTEPDLRSPAEARLYLEELRRILLYAEVSDCNMEEGSLRCDANISLRPRGAERLGVKNEIKNMNSFRGAERALEMVAEELAAALAAGEEIKQATWGYSIEKDRIFKLRAKEEAEDYRYFPEPDLPPLRISAAQLEQARQSLPEMPRARQR
ncbi:MAG: Asp-tRNA(Asn)/Glu-tRNA(Gln) amidotransferase subunit GatB, partial [Planctomycetota bacterium]|nr:Asp-tRNA(Asn)/Glu-tRNA(Gln) amidotransferase subunit GatB [Planctomycetota bacterium]